jgi:hypothetical protein
MAWDHFGNLWMTYLLNVGPDTMVAVSTDGGLSFTLVAKIAPTTPKGSKSPKGAHPKRLRAQGNHFADQPSISVGANSLWVSYASFPSTVIEASGAEVRGLGRFGKFSPPEPVESGPTAMWALVAVEALGPGLVAVAGLGVHGGDDPVGGDTAGADATSGPNHVRRLYGERTGAHATFRAERSG